MLHNLDFLDAGATWPPPSEKDRLKRYEEGRYLFEGAHDKVYGNWWRTLRQDLRASLEIVFNFPRRLSNLWADLLVGEPPAYTTEADENTKAVGDLVQETRFNSVMREVVIDMSRFGDGLFKVRLRDGKPHVEAVSPELWFPVTSRGDVREITHHVIAWTFEEGGGGLLGSLTGSKERYLVAEIHTKDAVEHVVKRVAENGKIGADVDGGQFFSDWEPRQAHKGGAPLIVHVPNQRTSNRLYGYDDYTDLDGPLQEYEVRLSQWSRINDHHADPPMAGPVLAPPIPGTEEAMRVASGEKYITIEPAGRDDQTIMPQYITWDQNVASITSELDRLETIMYTTSETSPAAFGQIRAGASESGTSLKLQMKSERSKAARLRTDLDPAAKEAIRLATALAGNEMSVDIAWKDGLPDDEKEQTQIEAQKRQSGLTSLVSSLQRLEDLDEEGARQEIERMQEEAANAPTPEANGSLSRSRKLLEGLTGDGAEG